MHTHTQTYTHPGLSEKPGKGQDHTLNGALGSLRVGGRVESALGSDR